MSEFKNNILEAIGNTPLVRLNKVTRGVPGELYAKCEFMNPGGSIKDRIGAYIIEQAEKKGELKPGGTVVEATSGNTGMGLAITAAVKGYKTVFVMPDKMSEEKRQNLRAFGARVVITPTGVAPDSPLSHYCTAARIAKETPNSFYSSQYNNLDNQDTHFHQTGPEIWKQTGGNFDAIVIGMGTCGTISGIGRYLKQQNPKIKVIGVDPKGSILKDTFDKKPVTAHTYKIEGIGEDMIPGNYNGSIVDEIICVEDLEAYRMTRNLVSKEGIFVGSSSGAAVVGALRWMSLQKNPGKVLVILPDSGNRYLSKAFNDAWMIENGFMEKQVESSVGDMARVLHKAPYKVACVSKADTIEKVVTLMRQLSVSQLPVMCGTEVCGMIKETDLLRPLISGGMKPSDKIENCIDTTSYILVQESDPIERLHAPFTEEKVAIVHEAGKVKHILTMIDLISFVSNKT